MTITLAERELRLVPVIDPHDTTWQDFGLCRQAYPDEWFPEGPQDGKDRGKAAKIVCGRCPVRRQCYSFALATGQRYGIWGGVSFEGDIAEQPDVPPVPSCSKGHPWTPESTYWRTSGSRECRICKLRRDLDRRIRIRAAAKKVAARTAAIGAAA